MTKRARPGELSPQGAHWDGRGTNFYVFSEVATDICLCWAMRMGPSSASVCQGHRVVLGTRIYLRLVRSALRLSRRGPLVT
jgi:hypothetical protein